MMWKEVPSLNYFGKAKLIIFLSSYLVECGFSTVVDLLHAKRNQLEIVEKGDLMLKLTKLEPHIKQICNQHQAQTLINSLLTIVINTSKL